MVYKKKQPVSVKICTPREKIKYKEKLINKIKLKINTAIYDTNLEDYKSPTWRNNTWARLRKELKCPDWPTGIYTTQPPP